MARIFDYKEEEGKHLFYEHKKSLHIYIREDKPEAYARLVDLKDGATINVSLKDLSEFYRPVPRFTTFSVEV